MEHIFRDKGIFSITYTSSVSSYLQYSLLTHNLRRRLEKVYEQINQNNLNTDKRDELGW